MTSATKAVLIRNNFFGVLADYAQLFKARVTALIVLTAGAGYYLGSVKTGHPVPGTVFDAMLGIGLVSAGTAGLNEAIERDIDARMPRTADRPLPAQRMSVVLASFVSCVAVLGGAFYLALTTNILAGVLTFLTSVVYLGVYTPLKRRHTACTFVGAFPGAMPALLGWVAARGAVEWEALVLFVILFLWQFPHFYAIAWLYREDYEQGGIRMLPVVSPDGRATAREILGYSLALLPATAVPFLIRMAGGVYLQGALVLGTAMLWFSWRLWRAHLRADALQSKPYARRLLHATVIYLPLLFALMMINATVH